MKKIICFSLLVIFTLPYAFAQSTTKKAEIHWSDIFKQKREILADYIGKDHDYYYILIDGKKSYFLEKWDMDLSLVKREELAFEKSKNYLQLERLFLTKDYIYCFSSSSSRRDEENKLLLDKYDKNTLRLVGEQEELSSFAFEKSFFNWNTGYYNMIQSRDSSKIMVYFALPYEKGESEKIAFMCFDNELNQIWERNIELPYNDELFIIKDYSVDNQGNMYLLGKVFKEKTKNRRKGEVNYHYTIISYQDMGQNLIEYPVIIEGKYITDMQINVNDYDDIVCAGFYSDKHLVSITGSYFLRIDRETKDIDVEKYEKFEMEFITQNFTERQEKKTKKRAAKGKNVEMYEYDLDDIIMRGDGGAVLIGEQYYVRVVTTTHTNANGTTYTTTTYYYYYNDIIVINYDPSGEVEWKLKIPKRQVSTNDNGFHLSYVRHIKDDKIYFVFNDDPQNMYLKEHDKIRYFTPRWRKGKTHLVLVEVNSAGEMEKEVLLNNEEAALYIAPYLCSQINKDESFLYAADRKKGRFGILKFY